MTKEEADTLVILRHIGLPETYCFLRLSDFYSLIITNNDEYRKIGLKQ